MGSTQCGHCKGNAGNYQFFFYLPAQESAFTPFRAAVSKPARRAYIGTILFAITNLILLGAAVAAYSLFYLNYIPQIGLDRVIHLQFG